MRSFLTFVIKACASLETDHQPGATSWSDKARSNAKAVDSETPDRKAEHWPSV